MVKKLDINQKQFVVKAVLKDSVEAEDYCCLINLRGRQL